MRLSSLRVIPFGLSCFIAIAACHPPAGPTPQAPSGDGALVTPASPISPLLSPLAHSDKDRLTVYHGLSKIDTAPQFEIRYNPVLWQFKERPHLFPAPALGHTDIGSCALYISFGPLWGANLLGSLELGGYEWSVNVDESSLNMTSYYLRAAGGFYSFTLIAPEPFSFENKSACQQQAEEVIATFALVDH